ncbi:glycosyltransferase [Enterococcus sp. LJL120]
MKNVDLKNEIVNLSVVLATYNGEKYLQEQIDSILAQTKKIDEVVFVDDNSQDSTQNIIESNKDLFVKKGIAVKMIFRDENMGYINNFLDGINRCSGRIIFTCDQDDIWLPNKTSEMVKIFNHDQILAIHSNTQIIDNQGNIINRNGQGYEKKLEQIGLHKFIKKVNYPGMSLAFKATPVVAILNKLKDQQIDFPTHDWVICYIACLMNGFYITDKILTLRRYTGENVALDITSRRISSIEKRIQGINLYRVYYDFIEVVQKKNIEYKKIEIGCYIKNSKVRVNYLQNKSIRSWIYNLKRIGLYPSIKSFIADGVLLVKTN